MDLLDHPETQRLLRDAELDPDPLPDCATRLHAFAQRHLPRFARREHRDHALVILRGKLTGLQPKTTKPIATQVRLHRRPLQLFVGAANWDDRAVLTELQRPVAAEVGDADGAFLDDSSGFPKKGTELCGIGRQWCGRLGKLDNCQAGVFLAYAARRGKALRDARLYLPDAGAADGKRRQKTSVPTPVAFAEH
jgi:SRSO17 transposase